MHAWVELQHPAARGGDDEIDMSEHKTGGINTTLDHDAVRHSPQVHAAAYEQLHGHACGVHDLLSRTEQGLVAIPHNLQISRGAHMKTRCLSYEEHADCKTVAGAGTNGYHEPSNLPTDCLCKPLHALRLRDVSPPVHAVSSRRTSKSTIEVD